MNCDTFNNFKLNHGFCAHLPVAKPPCKCLVSYPDLTLSLEMCIFSDRVRSGYEISKCLVESHVTTWSTKPHGQNMRMCGKILRWPTLHRLIVKGKTMTTGSTNRANSRSKPVTGRSVIIECGWGGGGADVHR